MQGCGLSAWELFCRRGDRLLFGSLDLTLRGGEALHLVGPNGIGKTSLIRILAGLLRPSSIERPYPGTTIGSVTWDGSIGLLDDRPALDPDLALGKALAFWKALDGSQAPVDRLALGELLDVPVRLLSTGQKKRAAFARLFGQRADHWLLDEPLNGLDRDGVTMVEDLIAERREGGGVVVFASHQPIVVPAAQRLDLRDHPA